MEETRRRRSAQRTGRTRPHERCPVCRASATLTDWRPHANWMTVEDCACEGFFVWTPLLDDGRLTRLTPEDRETLSQRIRHLHGTKSEAWLATPGRHRVGGLDHPHRAAGRPDVEGQRRPPRAHSSSRRADIAAGGRGRRARWAGSFAGSGDRAAAAGAIRRWWADAIGTGLGLATTLPQVEPGASSQIVGFTDVMRTVSRCCYARPGRQCSPKGGRRHDIRGHGDHGT